MPGVCVSVCCLKHEYGNFEFEFEFEFFQSQETTTLESHSWLYPKRKMAKLFHFDNVLEWTWNSSVLGWTMVF